MLRPGDMWTGDRAGKHDAPAFLLLHRGEAGLDREERTFEIDREHLVPFFFRHVLDEAVGIDASDLAKNIDAPAALSVCAASACMSARFDISPGRIRNCRHSAWKLSRRDPRADRNLPRRRLRAPAQRPRLLRYRARHRERSPFYLRACLTCRIPVFHQHGSKKVKGSTVKNLLTVDNFCHELGENQK